MTQLTPTVYGDTPAKKELTRLLMQSDDPVARTLARKKRAISSGDLLELLRKDGVVPTLSRQADMMNILASIPIMTSDEEAVAINSWFDDRCEIARSTLLTSTIALQFRYLLKKGNFGEDLFDILHDAFVEVTLRLNSEARDVRDSFRSASLLSILWARNNRALVMRRQVAAPGGIAQRKALNAIMNFDIDDVATGIIDVAMIAGTRGLSAREFDTISDVTDFLSSHDVDAEEYLTCESHEDSVLASLDARQLPGVMSDALDERSQDVVRRRWLMDEREDADTIAADWNITPERVRQLERQALADLKNCLEGKQTTLDITRRRREIQAARKKKTSRRGLSKDRCAIKGVNLEAAKKRLDNLLSPKSAEVLRARYFSDERVPTYREICRPLDLTPSSACVLENNALSLLRAHFSTEAYPDA